MSISYSGVVLDEASKANILGLLGDMIPSGWTPYAHHLTITMGPLKHAKASKRRKGHNFLDSEDLPECDPQTWGAPGTPWTMEITEVGIDDRAMAVKVGNIPKTRNCLKGGFAHITIAVNTAEGGKPFHSNKIPLENFKSLAELGLPPITVKGTVQEVPNQ